MFSAQLYSTYYNHGMLLLVLLAGLIYSQGPSRMELSTGFNSLMIWLVSGVLLFFLGTRPIDGAFVDMTTYAASFEITQKTGKLTYPDLGFNLLIEAVALVSTVEVFFFACCTLYILPLVAGMRHRHGPWAFAAFLMLAGGFSFYSYAVNGIRNGISTSLLLAAFAFVDRKIVMFLLMALAASIHKSVLLPIAAFIIAGFFVQPWVYGMIWGISLCISALGGAQFSNDLLEVNTFGDDDRFSKYAEAAGFGADRGGFRADFVLYSILPIIVSYSLSTQTVKQDVFYKRLVCTYLLANSFWLLSMYAAFSNRFAYLSWFMMPWIIAYPFLPERNAHAAKAPEAVDAPRIGMLGAALVVHFAFTYIMMMFVYPARGG